jgi:hypothetical protein
MAHIGYGKNERGTLFSRHRCDTCATEFILYPAVFPETKGWEYCLARGCSSYDAGRDGDLLFGSDGFLKEGITLQPGPGRRVGSA